MDLKYISENKLLMINGLLGTIVCSIICTITTYAECEKTKINNKDLYDYICIVNNTDNNTHSKYFDSFYIYFKNFEPLEILTIIFQAIFFFFYRYFSILTIKLFTPVHLIVSIPALYIIQKVILIINTLITKHSFFNDNNFNFKTEKFCLDFSGDIISMLGLIIYLEIIE
jgi:hypothetical protein